MLVLGVNASPNAGGHTAEAVTALLNGARERGAIVRLMELASDSPSDVIAAMGDADAFVFGAPVYRAAAAAPLKGLLDQIPRARFAEDESPLTGRAAAIVLTGAGWYHYLALDSLRGILASFFAAHVVPPGLYLSREGFDESGALVPESAELANAHGRALFELARCLEHAPALAGLRPQA